MINVIEKEKIMPLPVFTTTINTLKFYTLMKWRLEII
jgi:hypothetical protein